MIKLSETARRKLCKDIRSELVNKVRISETLSFSESIALENYVVNEASYNDLLNLRYNNESNEKLETTVLEGLILNNGLDILNEASFGRVGRYGRDALKQVVNKTKPAIQGAGRQARIGIDMSTRSGMSAAKNLDTTRMINKGIDTTVKGVSKARSIPVNKRIAVEKLKNQSISQLKAASDNFVKAVRKDKNIKPAMKERIIKDVNKKLKRSDKWFDTYSVASPRSLATNTVSNLRYSGQFGGGAVDTARAAKQLQIAAKKADKGINKYIRLFNKV